MIIMTKAKILFAMLTERLNPTTVLSSLLALGGLIIQESLLVT